MYWRGKGKGVYLLQHLSVAMQSGNSCVLVNGWGGGGHTIRIGLVLYVIHCVCVWIYAYVIT